MERENKIVPTNLSETRETYEAPVIETIEVRVEQGFQLSPDSRLDSAPDDDASY